MNHRAKVTVLIGLIALLTLRRVDAQVTPPATQNASSNQIAFIAGSRNYYTSVLHIIDSAGSDEHKISLQTQPPLLLSWSPTRKLLAVTVGDVTSPQIFIVNVTDNTIFDYIPSFARESFWSPNGQRLAYQEFRGGASNGFCVTPIPVYQPDPQREYVQCDWYMGESALTGQQNAFDNGDVWMLGWSPDGKYLIFTGRKDTTEPNEHLYIVNSDGMSTRLLLPESGYYAEAAWSPDSQHIIVGLCIISIDDTTKRCISDAPGRFLINPAWSPDGKHITYLSITNDNRDDVILYIMNADQTHQQRLTPDNIQVSGFAWSPDSTQIIFTVNEPDFYPNTPQPPRGNAGLYIMNADGSNVRKLTHDSTLSYSEPVWLS